MVDIFVYTIHLPHNIKESICPCADGNYTVYISDLLDAETRKTAVNHAVRHILHDHFNADDVQAIECEAHDENTEIAIGKLQRPNILGNNKWEEKVEIHYG